MKKFCILSFSALVVLGLSSCKKDFLVANPGGNNISNQRIEELSQENPSTGKTLQDGVALGLYSWMYKPGAGGTTQHYDFGQKSIDLILDILSGDFVKSRNGWGQLNALQSYQVTTDKTTIDAYLPWRYTYRIIFTANSLLATVGGEDVVFDDQTPVDLRHSYGQAIAMRGYAYFYLSQLYSSEYIPEKKLVPIYLSNSTADQSVKTLGEVVQQAISDLSKGISLLDDFTRDEKYQINADVARMYLAYLYGYMGKYDEVEKLTGQVIASNKYTKFGPDDIVYPGKPTGKSGMGDVTLPGVMWGVDIITEMGLDLISFWGFVDFYSFSYLVAGDYRSISNALYHNIHEDDIRRNQFATAYLLPINKFYHKDRVPQGQRVMESDYIYMRYDETILLNIEAKAMLGKESEARTLLKTYLSDRIADTSYIDALTGDDLKNEILLQTRIEFLGEGRALFAFRRFKHDLILGTNRVDTPNAGIRIPYNDDRLIFLIPENEETNNPNLYK